MPSRINKLPFAPKLERKKRVAAYACVSTAKDAMLHSLSSQIGYYSESIQKHSDREYAGSTLTKLRPAQRKAGMSFKRSAGEGGMERQNKVQNICVNKCKKLFNYN